MFTTSMQKDMELSYSMKALHKEWRELFEASEGFMEQYNVCLDYLTRWVAHEHSSELKNARLAQLDKELLPEMLWAVLLSIISFAHEEQLFINIAFKCVNALGMHEREEAIHTAFEMIGMLSRVTNLFSVYKITKQGSLRIKSNMQLSKGMVDAILEREYSTPIFSKPKEVKQNFGSAYQTKCPSIFNGSFLNHSDYNAALDALNLFNSTRYAIDEDFVENYNEVDDWDVTNNKNYAYLSQVEILNLQQMQQRNFARYRYNSLFTIKLCLLNGNNFSLNHKYDKRGRMYTDSYYLNPQGNDYKKCTLNAADSCDIKLPPELNF